MTGHIVHDGPGVVLVGAYVAGGTIRVGDALKLDQQGRLVPSFAVEDDVVGIAQHSAFAVQPVGLVIGGMARVIAALPVAIGGPVGPSLLPGRAEPPPTSGIPSLRALRVFGLAAEPGTPGKPFWIHLKVGS